MSIEIKGLTKKYKDQIVFQELSLVLQEGIINCIEGPSGCGKTTLLNILSGITSYDAGEISGISGKKFSYIFQEDRLLPWFNVLENILFVLENDYSKDVALTIADQYLDMVGLSDYKTFYERELSGGMKRRVSVARAFAYPSEILIMDEPFQGLDIELKIGLLKSFQSIWSKNKRTVLYVTHDMVEKEFVQNNMYAQLIRL